jgi:hypothetical protein
MRYSKVTLLTAVALAIWAAPADASVTLGSLPASPFGMQSGTDYAQLAVSSGPGYVVPGNGTITSWRTNAISASNQKLTMKIFRKVADPAFYMVVAHDGPRDLASGLVNPFTTSIPVQAGDIPGVYSPSANPANTYNSTGSGDSLLFRSPGLNDGEQASFGQFNALKINLQAVFEPSNTVTVGGTTRNKKKGTATLKLTLPNPGELVASGKGVKAASAGNAVISKAVGAGPARLLIKAEGKKRKKLNTKGKVKLEVNITYTPANGDPATQSVKVKLKKKR